MESTPFSIFCDTICRNHSRSWDHLQSNLGIICGTGIILRARIICGAVQLNFSRAKQSVMTALHVQYSISYDQYDVCGMVKDKSLSKLKLGVLKLLCENLNISMPVDQRRKAPYISLLEDLVKTCSCSSG